ncbi:MAG: hypothetical protein ABIS29_00805 [Vicinamibacterales bacterium]
MKTIIKLIVAALILHATWRAGTVYLRYYGFKDDVTQVAQFGVNQTDNQLLSGVLDAARRRDIVLPDNAVNIKRQNHHIIIDTHYTEQVELAPRYFYPWDAKVHVDVLTLVLQESK